MARTQLAKKAPSKADARVPARAPRPRVPSRKPARTVVQRALPAQPLAYADLIAMVELIERAEAFSEFRLKVGAIEIEFKRKAGDRAGVSGVAAAAAPAAGPSVASGADDVPSASPPPGSSTPARPSSDPDAALPPGTIAISAPMVGTFYRAPTPGATPFVEAGQRVEAGTTLCIIEVMKLMNTVDARTAGTVVEIRVQDAHPVRQDQVLIVFRPQR